MCSAKDGPCGKEETTLGSVAIFVGAVLSSFASELFAVSLASLLG